MTKKISFIALSFCYLVMIYVAFFFHPKWKDTRTEATISWDVSGYYMYLPALFIYKDLKHCAFKDSIIPKYNPSPDFGQAFLHSPSGNYVMKYSSGHALTMLPFFAIAHTYCKLNPKFPADGFSFPYQFCLGVGMLLYAFIGLYFLRKILLQFYKDATVAILLLCYVIGSNYLNYATIDQAMTHNVLFTIYCLIIYFTIRFHANPKGIYAIITGSLIGLATLIRPTDIVSVLIPLFWNVSMLEEVNVKFKFISTHFSKYMLMALSAIFVFSIQIIYWRYVANEWFVYSYEDQGFSWFHPHIFNYTIGYKCGWLRYTPMMILPLIGCLFYLFKGKHKFAILAFICVNSYIVMAWDIWDYGGTAGRAMIQSYPILAFPFCMLIEKLQESKWQRVLLMITILTFSYINIWWTYHAHAGNIQVTNLTKSYFWRVIGRWNGSDEDKKLLDNPHAYFGTLKNITTLYSNDFTTDTSPNILKDSTNHRIRLNKALQLSAAYVIKRNTRFKKWIRAYADFTSTLKEWDEWKQTRFILRFSKDGAEIQENFMRIYPFLSNYDTKNIYMDAIVPEQDWDHLIVSFSNEGGDKELYIDNMKVISFDE